MIKCPIIYYEKNLIFDDNKSCWGVFKLNGFDYDNLSEESKLDIHHQLTRLFSTIIDESKTLVIPSFFDLDAHYKNFENTLDEDDVLYDYALWHSRETKQYLNNKRQDEGTGYNDYETYITVKLVTEEEAGGATGVQGLVEALFKNPLNAIETFMHTREKDIMGSKVKRFEKLAERFFAEQDKRISMRHATPIEIQYLLKRTTYKGIEHAIKLNLTRKLVVDENGDKKVILSDWTPYAERSITKSGKDVVLRPYFRDTINLIQGRIDKSEDRMLKIIHNDGSVSYQTYMVIAHIPYAQDFPNNEWIYLLQNLNVQAEICIHTQNIEHRQALRELELQNRKIKSQYENISEVAEDAGDTIDSYQQSKELEAELKASRLPITKTCISICLYGQTPEEVEAKAEFVRSTYADLDFVIERPVSDQFEFFQQHIPGTGKYVDAFTMPLLPQTLAGGVIGANNQLGDNVGKYIGTTGKLNKPVFLDMGLACLINKSPAATLFGRLGYGKSFFLNLLALLNVIYGGFALIFDPKGERWDWIRKLPMLEGLINIVSLNADKKNKGKLDPFIIYKNDFDKAAELALNVLVELNGISPRDKEFTALLQAIEKMRKIEKPCMAKLCDILESFEDGFKLQEEAKMLAMRTRSFQNIGMFMLFFGTGEEEAINLDYRLTVICMDNLSLPGPETKKEDYTMEELISVVVVMVVGGFAKRFALIPRNVFSVIGFDESWALAKTVMGQKIYDFLARQGRSLYCGCIFNGHSVLDIPTEGVKNSITYKFCFNMDNYDEIVRMLNFLDMEVTPENIELIKKLGNGECLFRDAYGRIGVLKIDAVLDDFKNAFDTTPKTKKQADAERVENSITEAEESVEDENIKVAHAPVIDFEDIFVREVINS